MKRDGSVARTAGQDYSLIVRSATSGLSKCGVTAPTVGNPHRKNKFSNDGEWFSVHPFVPSKEIASGAEALTIVFAPRFFLFRATTLAPSIVL
jgi:hypothetical protein